MQASAELQSKLQRRLVLQHEAASPTHWERRSDRRQHKEEPRAHRVVLDFSSQQAASADEAQLLEQIERVLEESRQAWRRKQEVETSAMSRGIELGTQVARLRIEAEVHRRELQAAQDEVHRLSKDSTNERRRSRALRESAARVQRELDIAGARRETLISQMLTSRAQQDACEEAVRALEAEVERHVIDRMRLEGSLRTSLVREAELRRLLDAAEQKVMSPQRRKARLQNFALDNSDSDAEGGGDGDDDFERDLEFSYEGLELSGLMPLERARQLARRRGSVESPGSAAVSEAESPLRPLAENGLDVLDDDALYEAPLRELQHALSRLMPAYDRPQGGSFDEHLGMLDWALQRLNASASRAVVTESGSELGGAPHAEVSPVAEETGEAEGSEDGFGAASNFLASSTVMALRDTEPGGVSPGPHGSSPAPATPPSSPSASPSVAVAAVLGMRIGAASLFASPYAKLGAKYAQVA